MNIIASAVYKITLRLSTHLGDVVSCDFEEAYSRVLSGPQYYRLLRLLRTEDEPTLRHLKVTIRSAMCICSLLRSGLIALTKAFSINTILIEALNWAPAVFRIEDSLSPE